MHYIQADGRSASGAAGRTSLRSRPANKTLSLATENGGRQLTVNAPFAGDD